MPEPREKIEVIQKDGSSLVAEAGNSEFYCSLMFMQLVFRNNFNKLRSLNREVPPSVLSVSESLPLTLPRGLWVS